MPASSLKGLYTKVLLKNLKIWEPCPEENATDWLHPLEANPDAPNAYPIRPKWLHLPSLDRFHLITQPDGALWPDGCLYLFSCATIKDLDQSTVANISADLADFMNKMLSAGKDYEDFGTVKLMRPTYLYKSKLKTEIAENKIKIKVANRKISSVVGFYKWKTTDRGFKPNSEMWKTKLIQRAFTDRYGETQSKEVYSTDLTFKSSRSISTGRFIRDGGNLYPLSRPDQQTLIHLLVRLDNPEMLLAHITSLISGLRLQSVLTLRHCDVKSGIGGDNDSGKYALHYINIGENHLTESKNRKPQAVAIPAWMHHKLNIYINSHRHQQRAKNCPIKDKDTQYVFLTRTGKPYYIAKNDRHLFGYSAEAGSALRQFKKKIITLANEVGTPLNYRFHDLRATFGMNLLEDLTQKVDGGYMNQLELLDILRTRLCHEETETTMGYLRYRETNPLIAQAQSEFEEHLEGLIRTEQEKHEHFRTRDLPN